MHDIRLHKYYYRAGSGYGSNSLMHRFLGADRSLRHFLNLNSYCGAVTVVAFIFAAIVALCSITSLNMVTTNDTRFHELLAKAKKKLPRLESVVNIIPPYKCIHKHLQRMGVFQEKTKKILRKEQLELEIMSSKASCIKKLLKLEEESEWHRSKSPKVYHRPISAETSK